MSFPFRSLLLGATILLSTALFSQTSLPAATVVTQTFNSIGSSATATLPANWRLSPSGNAVGAWSAGVSATTQAASSGLPSAGGRYNWATTAGTDRTIGFLTDVSYGTPNAVMAHYRNTTGTSVNSFTIAFAIERYVVNTGSFTLVFESSTDGTTWTAQPGGSIAPGVFASGTNAGTFTSPQTVYKTLTISATVANNADIYFRWIFNTSNTTSQGLGLDNVSVFAGTATPLLTARLRDILQVDNGVQNQFNIGDDIRYQTVIKNIGTADAANVQITIPPPANTTLVPGSIKTSSVARDDNYTTGFDAPLNVSTVPTGVLNNDFGVPSPGVLSFGPTANAAATAAAGTGTSDNGGTVTLNGNGTFTYTPLTGFSGVDKFAYIAGNGNLPNNEGTVTITVGAAATVTNDVYTVIGNVSIVPNATQGVLNNDAGGGLFVASVNGSAANVGVPILTANGGNLTVNANGSFTYNPAKGYEGSDNFTYTANNGIGTASTTATVTLTVAGMIWFIDGSAAAGGDGRRSTPFNNIASFQAINIGGAGNADANDFIYVFENAAQYNGSFSLLNGQKLIGQDATIALGGAGSITGYTVPAYSTPLPVNNSANGTRAIIGTSVASTNVINLVAGASNTLRGFRIGNTTGFGINSTGFGTLTVLEVDKNGTGGALNLANGALAAAFTDIISTSSAAQGINLAGITGLLTVTNTTSLTGTTTQGILVGTTTASINFGHTTISSGSDGVSLQNNSSGSRAFGTLSITHNGAGAGFLHTSGGTFTAGGTTISNTGGTGVGIDIQNLNADIGFGATTVSKTGSGTGVTIAASGAGSDVTFASLDITTANGAGLVGTTNGGQIIVTAAGGDINATNGAAINLSQATGTSAVNLNLSGVTSSGAANGIVLTNIAGTINGGTGTITASGTDVSISGGTVSLTYSGNITQAANAAMISVSGGHATGTITFNTGALSATNGTGLQFDNADGIYNFNGNVTLNGADAGVDIVNGSTGSFSFTNTAITNPSGTAMNVNGGNGAITHTGSISKTSAGRVIEIQNRTGGTILFAGAVSGTVSSTGINLATNTGATINFTGALTLNGTASVFSATGGGTVTATNTGSTIGNITPPTSSTALTIANTTIGALGVTFQRINSSANTVGILLSNTGSSGGLMVTGTGTTAGSGGIINQSSAAAADNTLAGIGISLTNTSNVSLSNMNFSGTFGNFGIRGDGVNNFTLRESNLTGVFGTSNNGAVYEGAIRFGTQGNDGTGNGLTGTVLFTGNTIGGGYTDNISIFNNSAGSMNMTVADGTNAAIFNHNGLSGNDAILIETRGPANGATFGNPGGVAGAGFNLTLSVNGVEFKGAPGDNIQTVAATNCTQNITVINNTFFNTHPNIVSGGGGISLVGGGPTSNYIVTYNVSNNQFKGAKGTPLHVNYSGQSATVSGIIVSNTIGTPNGTYNSASSQVGSSDNGNGINVTSEKFGDNVAGPPHSTGIINHAVRIQNNVVADVNGLAGIRVSAGTQDQGGSLRLEATITGNTVSEMGPFGYAAFYSVVGGASLTTDFSKVGLHITGNTFNAGGAGATNNGNAMSFDQVSVNARYYFPGYAGSQNGESASPPGTASANLNTFLQDASHLNVLTNGPFPNPSAGAGSKVDATLVVGVLGTAFFLPVP